MLSKTAAPGKGLLKITGILKVPVGIFVVLFTALTVSFPIISTYDVLVSCALIILGLLMIVSGVFGVMKCAVLDKAAGLKRLAIIEILITLVVALLVVIFEGNVYDLWYVILGFMVLWVPAFILAILYLIGALRNKRAYEGSQAS